METNRCRFVRYALQRRMIFFRYGSWSRLSSWTYFPSAARLWSTTPTVSSFSFSSYSSSSSSVQSSPPSFHLLTTIFQDQVAKGMLKPDRAQEKVVKRLTRLQQALVDYDNHILFRPPEPLPPPLPPALPGGANSVPQEPQLEGSTEMDACAANDAKPRGDPLVPPPSHSPQPPLFNIPRGIYLHGPVGTGKSMLMDAFFRHAPVTNKSRYHFHSFLAHVHHQIHMLKQRDLREKGRQFSIDTRQANNPIFRVGMEIAQSTSLLCLDEFQVTDIADAVILSQLFGVLFLKGTVVVTTSNRPPQDLYEGGLNRSYFLPFVDLLQRHCIVHEIQSNLDYRRVLSSSCSSFFGTDRDIQPIFQEVLESIVQVENVEGANHRSFELPVGFQRTLSLDHCYESSQTDLRAVRLDCVQLCDADVGSMDFQAIANHFDIVFLEQVPILDLEGHNRARRFITLVDELYESKCCVLLSTATGTVDNNDDYNVTTPMELFRGDTRKRQQGDDGGDEVGLVVGLPMENDPPPQWGVDVATQGGVAVGSLASVRELSFAFERASSRIVEMCSRSWWDKQLGQRHLERLIQHQEEEAQK